MKRVVLRLCLATISSVFFLCHLDKLLQTSSTVIDELLVPPYTSSQVHLPLNIIIFYPDDWRHDDLGDTNTILQTPFFSRLAKEGIRFTYNAVTTSICWISRATLFSGQWVSGHTSTYLSRPTFASDATRWSKTWPSILQRAGYWVGHVGKWQYHDVNGYKNKVFNYSSFFEGYMWQATDDGTKRHVADRAGLEAIKFLRERPKDKPFALTVAFYPPKGIFDENDCPRTSTQFYDNVSIPEPYDRNMAYQSLPPFLQDNRTEARSRYLYRFETHGTFLSSMRAQYSMISHIDSVCEEVTEELRRQGAYDNTVIIVTADNGEFHAWHALADKWYPYQESIRVPLIIKDPRIPKDKRGTLDDSFTLNVDLAPTILGAAGLDTPVEMQGRDIGDLYLGKPKSTGPWRSEFYYEFPDINGKIPPSYALIQKKWKYIRWPKHQYEQLFDLEADPLEFQNLVENHSYFKVKGMMQDRLVKLRHDVFAPLVPGTWCDPLWPRGESLDKKPDCSPEMTHRCCNASGPGHPLRQST